MQLSKAPLAHVLGVLFILGSQILGIVINKKKFFKAPTALGWQLEKGEKE